MTTFRGEHTRRAIIFGSILLLRDSRRWFEANSENVLALCTLRFTLSEIQVVDEGPDQAVRATYLK